jgi:hypothetical protein
MDQAWTWTGRRKADNDELVHEDDSTLPLVVRLMSRTPKWR